MSDQDQRMSEGPESRILVVSASLDQARAAVKLIKAFVDDSSDLPTSDTIPWTIKNKYYSADVHFRLVECAHWDPQSAHRVPAVIFVWARGQPYAEHAFALQGGLSRFEPEVALAIALGSEPPHHEDPPEGPDSFLADNGFEYIDGERTRHPEMPSESASTSASVTVENSGGSGDGDDDDVQGLPRVVDALSTIMWPTMVRREQNGGGKRKTRLQPSLFDFDDLDVRRAENDGEEETTLAALMAADAADHGLPLTRASRVQREMQALERWLVENEEMHEAEFGRGTGMDDDDDNDDNDADEGENKEDDNDDNDKDDGGGAPLSSLQVPVLDVRAPSKDDDPWAASSGSNPTPSTSTSTAQRHSTAAPSSGSGFDDDFSAFVSAPPAISFPVGGLASAWASSTSGSIIAPARPSAHGISQSLLKPSHTGGSFRSLRSAASDVDFEDDHLGYEALDDRSSLNVSPEHEHERGERAFEGDAEPGMSTSQGFGGRASDVPLDLANILSTLDTMREDMAGIEDEGERRARTARFASEFVFKSMSVDGDSMETKK